MNLTMILFEALILLKYSFIIGLSELKWISDFS
jgi:hypothetical protein